MTEEGLQDSSAKLVEAGDILYALYGATSGEVAISRINGAINQAILAIRPYPGYSSKFLLQWLQLQKESIIEKYIQGGQGNLSGAIVKGLTIDFAQSIEQDKIGTLFDYFDNLISLHQRKLDKLRALKESYLSKMFPAEGANKPELRFKGFTDAWEQRKLGEVSDKFDNLRIPIAAQLRASGPTPYYGANGIQDYVDGFTHDGEFILLAEDGANNIYDYPVHYVNGKIWVNNHAHVLQAKEGTANNLFLLVSLKSINMEPYLVGGGRAKLNADVMMKLPIEVPSIQEQVILGGFFNTLNNLISLHQRKLDKLKSLKEAYLAEMFV